MKGNRATTAAVAALSMFLGCKSGPTGSPSLTPSMPGAPASGEAAPATAQPPGAPRQTTTVEGITEYALDNGMRVLLFPDQSQSTVTVNVTYMVGSRHEGYGETGMAHLLEHMLFKGSPKHPKVWEELEQRGAANNASTWYDRTNYFETLPASDESLSWALEMEADRMTNSYIAQKDLDAEFSVVRNEFEMGENDPAMVLSERMWSTAYLWHNYGKSTIGSRADIERVPAGRLQAFYHKYYRPDNAVLVVAGKFEPAKTLAMINQTFGVIGRPEGDIPATYTVEPVQDGAREVALRRNGDVQILGLVYHVPAGPDPEHVAIEAIADILTAEPSGRLYKALVKTGMATRVSADATPLHDPGVLEIDITIPANKPIGPVRDKALAIIEGLAKSKIAPEETERFKAKEKKSFKLTFANSQRVAMFMSEWVAMGDWRLMFLNRDRIEKLTTEAVEKAAATYLLPSNRTLGTFIPTKTPSRAPLKEAPDVVAMTKEYKGRAAESEGEKFEATVANIEKRTKRTTLPSGMKVAMLAKQTRGDAVQAVLNLRFGREQDFKGRQTAALFLGDMMERGTKKHDFQALKDEWDRLEARVSFGSRPGALTVSISTTHENFPAVLERVDEILHQATFPADQFGISTKEYLSNLEESRSDPQQQAFIAYQRAVGPYPADHPLYTATTEESIAAVKRLKVAEVKQMYAWLGMSNATMTIVGDFDVDATEKWLAKTWGTWKSPRPFQRIAAKYTPTESGETLINTPDKENATIVAGYAIPMRDDDPDYPAMVTANYVLGGGGFVSRLMTRLRQKDGLSYGAFSFFQAGALDKSAYLGAGAILAPQNAVKGMKAMQEEFDQLIAGGVPAEELKQAQESLAKEFTRNLGNDRYVMYTLDEGLYVGRTMAFEEAQQAAIAKLTPQELGRIIKKYVKTAALFRVTGADKAKMN